MTGGIEGVGEAVTGAMLARAVEPQAGEQDGAEASCLNCETALVGAYCHQCGQAGHVHRSLTAFWHDLVHGVLHFEGKLWRTLPLLAWRPGELTRRYIAGERARFISPMALFLFSVFLMFAAFSAIGGPFEFSRMGSPETQAHLRRQRAAAERTLAQLQAERARTGADVAKIDERIAAARREVHAIDTVSIDPDGQSSLTSDVKIDGAPGWFDRSVEKAKANPSLLAYKLQSNAYKFSWLLIPLSVPFVWLLFAFRRQYHLYDHLVFVTYSIAFMTLLLVLLSVLGMIGIPDGWILLLAAVVPVLHMARQLKGAYMLGRFAAAWRALLLAVFALIAGLIFFTIMVAMEVV